MMAVPLRLQLSHSLFQKLKQKCQRLNLHKKYCAFWSIFLHGFIGLPISRGSVPGSIDLKCNLLWGSRAHSPYWHIHSRLGLHGCGKMLIFLLWRRKREGWLVKFSCEDKTRNMQQTNCSFFLHAGKPTATITSVWLVVREADGGS